MNLPRNVIFNFVSWLLPIGATIVFTPIIVRGLGIENYGIYALVTGFIAYSFYLAVSRVIPVYVAEYRVKNQTEKIGEVVSATLAINLLIGFVALIFFLTASPWLVKSVLHISHEHQRDATLSFYLAGGTLLFMMASQVFNSIPQALHRFDIYSSIALMTTLLVQIGNVLLVLAGYHVVTLFVWNFVLIIFNCIIYWLVAKRLLPEAKLTLKISRSMIWSVIKYSGGVITYQILANSLLIFERSWLTRTSGHESVTFYAVPMMIALSLHAFISSIALVIFPLATEANAQQNKERLKSIYTRSLKILNVLIVFPVVTLCVCSHTFLTVWISADFANRTSLVLILLTIAFGLIAFGIVSWSTADGLGRPWFNALLVLSWILIAVPVMFYLTPKMNVIGSAYGRFFSTVLTIPIYTLLIERWAFGKCLWGFWAKNVFLLGLSGVVAGFVQHFLISHLHLSWLTFGFVVCVSSFIFYVGLWLSKYFEKEEKDWLLNRFYLFNLKHELHSISSKN
jgi:O-antigen/teichoic acid export membrane protein